MIVCFGWTPNTEKELAGYEMYRGIVEQDRPSLAVISKFDSSYCDNTAEVGMVYFYHLVAFDSADNRSAPSNTVIIYISTDSTVYSSSINAPMNLKVKKVE
jgi:hypothetical protein